MSTLNPYAKYLDGRKPETILSATAAELASLLAAMGAEKAATAPAPGKWSPAEIVCHLADCEIAFGFRVRQIVAEPALQIQTFDENRWARHYDKVDGLQAATTFKALRAWNLALFRRLSAEELAVTAPHPERGPESAETVIRIMAGHTLHHLAQLEKILAG